MVQLWWSKWILLVSLDIILEFWWRIDLFEFFYHFVLVNTWLCLYLSGHRTAFLLVGLCVMMEVFLHLQEMWYSALMLPVIHYLLKWFTTICLTWFLCQGKKASSEKPRSTGKAYFVETRTFWHIFRSFDRLWTFYILALQAFNFINLLAHLSSFYLLI